MWGIWVKTVMLEPLLPIKWVKWWPLVHPPVFEIFHSKQVVGQNVDPLKAETCCEKCTFKPTNHSWSRHHHTDINVMHDMCSIYHRLVHINMIFHRPFSWIANVVTACLLALLNVACWHNFLLFSSPDGWHSSSVWKSHQSVWGWHLCLLSPHFDCLFLLLYLTKCLALIWKVIKIN